MHPPQTPQSAQSVAGTLPSTGSGDAASRLVRLMFGSKADRLDLAPIPDLLSALLSLASLSRQKVLLPLSETPMELALVRRGPHCYVSYYLDSSAPEVAVLERPVEMGQLLRACANAAEEAAGSAIEPELLLRLAQRARREEVVAQPASREATRRRGGALEDPGADVALAFGFSVNIHPGADPVCVSSERADAHALLFDGTLWAWSRGQRIALLRGPIMLAVQRMVVAVRAIVDAWQAGRQANVRLRAGSFQVGMRLDLSGNVAVSLGEEGELATVPALQVADASLPVLRLASDLLRALVSINRAQSRNLRVRSLREEVRSLRRAIRGRERDRGFVNRDPDRLRPTGTSGTSKPASPVSYEAEATGRLRFAERWRLEVDELDAMSTFFCGDRLVIASPRRVVAVSRDSGDVLWAREGNGGTTVMAGTVLLRRSPDGVIELCDVEDGEPSALGRVSPASALARGGLFVGDRSMPPTVVLVEGRDRLVAIDVRTGEPRWRFAVRGGADMNLSRAGRVLLVASGTGAINALDVTSGELVWRYTAGSRFVFAPGVCRDVAVAATGRPGDSSAELHGVDLFSGERLWSVPLDAAPSMTPLVARGATIVSMGDPRHGGLACFDPRDGRLCWMTPDPGLGSGGASLVVDRLLIVNAPVGRVTAIDIGTGTSRWHRDLSDPVADDVPRRLEPVLRGGALFIPSACVHVLRPGDGISLGAALPCDLVPDFIRVDERGWVYVGEESGHLSAYAPVPHLSLVTGGTRD